MAHQHSARFLRVVEDARKRIREVSIDDVKARLDRGDKFLLLDVREEGEYAKDRPITFQNIFATLYHNLGLNPETTTIVDPTGRPQHLVDEPAIRELV